MRPCLAPWYRLVEGGDRLLLEHGRSVVVLEGAAVRVLLPALLPLLDGTRTVDELAARLGPAARPAIEQTLGLLAAERLLVEGPEPDPHACPAARTVAAAYGLAPAVAFDRLRAGTVGIAGTAPAAAEIARLLAAAGVGEVRRLPWLGGARAEVELAVAAPAPGEVGKLAAWNLAALESGRPWLGIRPFDGANAAVGPLVVPGESCCHECVLRRLAGHVEYAEDLAAVEAVPVEAGADPALDAIVAGLAAHLVLSWLGGRDAALPGLLFAIEARPVPAVQAHPVLRVPRCPACSRSEREAPRLPWHEAELDAA